MVNPPRSNTNWQVIAAELRAYRDEQRKIWGDLDDMQVARYLAGSCDERERAAVERAMRDYPAVQELVEGLREVLGLSADVATERVEATAGRMATVVWQLVEGVRELVAPLRAWVEEGGRLISEGMPQFQAQPSLVSLSSEQERGGTGQWSSFPLEPLGATLSVSCRFSADQSWEVWLAVASASAPDLVNRCLLEVDNATTGDVEMRIGLRECMGQPIYLESGDWRLTVKVDEQAWRVPLQLGAPQ